MNVHQTELYRDPVAVRQARSAEDFGMIGEPDCAAVLWRRETRPGFGAWIDALDPARLPRARLILHPGAVAEALRRLCDEAAFPAGPERDWLETDIVVLATAFAALTKAPYLRLRLDVITTNACSRFHLDAMTARLICTYRGSGTQYGISTDGSEPSEVFQAPSGAPMILRGSHWPESPPSGLRHRSPPIAGTGETRLVLVLDPIYDLEDAD